MSSLIAKAQWHTHLQNRQCSAQVCGVIFVQISNLPDQSNTFMLPDPMHFERRNFKQITIQLMQPCNIRDKPLCIFTCARLVPPFVRMIRICEAIPSGLPKKWPMTCKRAVQYCNAIQTKIKKVLSNTLSCKLSIQCKISLLQAVACLMILSDSCTHAIGIVPVQHSSRKQHHQSTAKERD